jgi:gluconate:H+ symporter, GntP family
MSFEAFRILVGLVISITFIILSTQRWRWHPFFSLLIAAIVFGKLAGISFSEIMQAIVSGFGSLLQQIGLVVAVGAVMGSVMEKTGAMEVLGLSITKLLEKKVGIAMLVIGLIVGIPVFCDSGFIVLSKLIPALSHSSGSSGAVMALSLSSGLYTSHTLIPPTPGPLAAATNLGLGENLGLVIVMGLLFSMPVALTAFWASRIFGRCIKTEQDTSVMHASTISVWRAVLPLVVPVVLIALGSFSKVLQFPGLASSILAILGMPVLALFIGLGLSFANLDSQKNPNWPDWISESLKDAGIILLITGAGGSFGAVIKASGLERVIQEFLPGNSLSESGILIFGFLIAALLKTAQGSTTSSMIITSSIVAPMAVGLGIASQVKLAFVLMSIGGGAMTVSHSNDSYFWVISKFGGITQGDMLKSFTPITLLQGLTVLVTALIAIQFA